MFFVSSFLRSFSLVFCIVSFQGESERALRSAFSVARSCSPSILFLDEIDTLCGGKTRDNEVSSRVLSTLLNEMDGVTGRGGAVIVVAATNRPDALDDALVRPGRLEKVV